MKKLKVGKLDSDVLDRIVLVAIEQAYGPDTFGPNKPFIATQASVVATMVSGIPSVPAFMVGLAAGIVIYYLGLPAMMVGLGYSDRKSVV